MAEIRLYEVDVVHNLQTIIENTQDELVKLLWRSVQSRWCVSTHAMDCLYYLIEAYNKATELMLLIEVVLVFLTRTQGKPS